MEGRGDASCSLLRGLISPLDVGDLQYGHQQLESILDVRCTVGRLWGKRIHNTTWGTFRNVHICASKALWHKCRRSNCITSSLTSYWGSFSAITIFFFFSSRRNISTNDVREFHLFPAVSAYHSRTFVEIKGLISSNKTAECRLLLLPSGCETFKFIPALHQNE